MHIFQFRGLRLCFIYLCLCFCFLQDFLQLLDAQALRFSLCSVSFSLTPIATSGCTSIFWISALEQYGTGDQFLSCRKHMPRQQIGTGCVGVLQTSHLCNSKVGKAQSIRSSTSHRAWEHFWSSLTSLTTIISHSKATVPVISTFCIFTKICMP